jgi:hypothetical protein
MKRNNSATTLKGGDKAPHTWRFARSGGVDQIVFRDGQDIARLRELDFTLWMALAMPIKGTDFDPRTAALLDTDDDGRIRPDEVLAAVDWAALAFRDLDELLKPGDAVALSSIKDGKILAAAKLLLENLGKSGADSVSMADVVKREEAFAGTLFNGDGVIPVEAADDEPTRAAIRDIISAFGPAVDRGGKPGVNHDTVEGFFTQADAWLAWNGRAKDLAVSPFGPEASAAAWQSIAVVKAKMDDYFMRCRLSAFDPRSAAALNRDENDYKALAPALLSASSESISALPLSAVAAGKALSMDGSINPAWADAIARFAQQAVKPAYGKDTSTLAESAWNELCSRFSAHVSWLAEEPRTPVSSLGAARLAELAAGGFRDRIETLIARDAALSTETDNIVLVEKLVRFRRDLYRLLTNYVNFSAFYGREGAIFQAGTLYLEARSCSLCVEVLDEGKHAALAGLSGAYLAYCDLSRPGGARKKIVAAITDGDSDNIMAGRNGVFYDNHGLEWDAAVVKLVANPISVREAFWLPYKKLARMIEEQIAKRAQAGDASSTAKLAETAGAVSNADKLPAVPKQEAPAKKLDLGTIALIGTAIGGISAMVAGFLQTIFGLGVFMPLGLLGIILLISGPSMILASLKLRKRNLAPLLDANGWAINTQARINIPFGESLTTLAALPPGSLPPLTDPFAEKKKPWKLYVWIFVIALVLAAGAVWRFGLLDAYLPESTRYSSVAGSVTKPAGK